MNKVTNFLNETLDTMKEIGKTFEDIVSIGSPDYVLTPEQMMLVFDVNYTKNNAEHQLPRDLTILFKDGSWLERWLNLNGESWFHASPPKHGDNPYPYSVPLPTPAPFDPLDHFDSVFKPKALECDPTLAEVVTYMNHAVRYQREVS